jgi:hypothetical protein
VPTESSQPPPGIFVTVFATDGIVVVNGVFVASGGAFVAIVVNDTNGVVARGGVVATGEVIMFADGGGK